MVSPNIWINKPFLIMKTYNNHKTTNFEANKLLIKEYLQMIQKIRFKQFPLEYKEKWNYCKCANKKCINLQDKLKLWILPVSLSNLDHQSDKRQPFIHPFVIQSIHPFIHSVYNPSIHSSVRYTIHPSIYLLPFIRTSSYYPLILQSIYPLILLFIHWSDHPWIYSF